MQMGKYKGNLNEIILRLFCKQEVGRGIEGGTELMGGGEGKTDVKRVGFKN